MGGHTQEIPGSFQHHTPSPPHQAGGLTLNEAISRMSGRFSGGAVPPTEPPEVPKMWTRDPKRSRARTQLIHYRDHDTCTAASALPSDLPHSP